MTRLRQQMLDELERRHYGVVPPSGGSEKASRPRTGRGRRVTVFERTKWGYN